MSIVPGTLSEWLKSVGLVEVASHADTIALWAELAIESDAASPLALRADAAAEGARQLEFLRYSLALETLLVTGYQSNLVGQSRRIECEEAGYEATPAVFVIGAEERPGGITILSVLRRLEAA